LEQALKIDPKDWLNWGNLGDTLFQIPARRAEARRAYQKAIELGKARLEVNPRDATVLGFTADYYAMLDQERQAREQMDQALKIAPTDPDLLFRAAILYNHLGDQDKTLDFLTKSVAAGCSRTLIRDTPDFEKLKNDPRLGALLSGT
jgi:tetratricopeptide (TPR) repeat protein